MAKAQTADVTPEEVVIDTPVTVEEVTPVVLNELVPEKEAPGHGSRDFNSSL